MLLRFAAQWARRRLGARASLALRVVSFALRAVRGSSGSTAVVRVPRGSKVVVEAVRERP